MLLLRFGSIIGRRRFPSEIGVDDRDGMFGGRVDDESVVTFFSEEDSAREEARESVSSCCRSLERDSSLLSETTKSVVSIGVLARSALIASIYKKATKLSGKAKTTISNGRLTNHIGTDVSRIDFCAGFFHMRYVLSLLSFVVSSR